jgi:hypothetical protein
MTPAEDKKPERIHTSTDIEGYRSINRTLMRNEFPIEITRAIEKECDRRERIIANAQLESSPTGRRGISDADVKKG